MEWDKIFVVVQSLTYIWLFATPWTAACQASLSLLSPGVAQTHVHWVGDAVQPSHPLSLPSLLAINLFPASGSFPVSRLSSSDGQSIGASASASVLPMNIQGWFPLRFTYLISLQSKALSQSLLQHHCSKASILRCSGFFMAQLSHPYMTTGKTIILIRQTFASKVMSVF